MMKVQPAAVLSIICQFIAGSLAFARPDGLTVQMPTGFRWCVASAAYQTEGDDSNTDWWQWEKLGKIRNGEKSGLADNDWNMLDTDVQLLKDLNVNVYRFSIEWARIEPEPGVWNQKAVAHYRHELQLLKQYGIKPHLTLYHWTLPLWVSRKGGWEWSQTPEEFEKFVEYVYKNIAGDVRYFVTLNEPMAVVMGGYANGMFPPGKADIRQIGAPFVNLLHAHALAYHKLHDLAGSKTIYVGLAHDLRIFEPYDKNSWGDKLGSSLADQVGNWDFVDAVETGVADIHVPGLVSVHESIPNLKGTEDYFGLNYYTRSVIRTDVFKKFWTASPWDLLVKQGESYAPDNGWEIYPEGLYILLHEIHKRMPRLEILITENGIADKGSKDGSEINDPKRIEFIKQHLIQVRRAIDDGIKVNQYCYWSFMDDFEWTDGWSYARFGLYSVNFHTFRRTPRASAKVFSRIALQNGF